MEKILIIKDNLLYSLLRIIFKLHCMYIFSTIYFRLYLSQQLFPATMLLIRPEVHLGHQPAGHQ